MAERTYSVGLDKVITEFKLEVVYSPPGIDEILITSSDVYRPGLQMASGFYEYFDETRLQIFGKSEHAYLWECTNETRAATLDRLMKSKIPALIVTRNMEIYDELLAVAQAHKIPILRTEENTSHFMAALIAWLNVNLAPRMTRHGVLVEVYGEGILILGQSGVGKSETAIELVKRGHRLVADDAVEIKRVSAKTLVGSAPEIIRHYIELRGIGIIDVRKIFGMGAVKETERLDLILHLEAWQDGKHYERLGLSDEFTNYLGVDIPSMLVPVRPGRNLAVIVEVAAMNNRQKKLGHNSAEALNEQLIRNLGF